MMTMFSSTPSCALPTKSSWTSWGGPVACPMTRRPGTPRLSNATASRFPSPARARSSVSSRPRAPRMPSIGRSSRACSALVERMSRGGGTSTIIHAIPLALLVCAVHSRPSAAQSGNGRVVFAEPGDPVFRAIYPKMDATTGLTPVAEPEVAASRGPARRPDREKCDGGFRVAEPATKEWSHGGTGYRLASFFVTTEERPGSNAPCYRPEPWVCVLEKKAGDSLAPVDCTRVEQDFVFPGVSSLDTAPFRLNEAEKAFGVRLRHESGT